MKALKRLTASPHKKAELVGKTIIRRRHIFPAATFSWTAFILLSSLHNNSLDLLNIVGFLSLVIIPGLLTVLSLKISATLSFWYRFGLIIGFSVLELMVWVLLWNSLLPHFHVPRPLNHVPLLYEMAGLYMVIVGFSWPRLRGFSYEITKMHLFKSWGDRAVLCIGPLLLLLSVLGATSLNNGGTDLFTLSMLIAMSAYMVILLSLRKRLSNNTFAWALYMMSLSLLLMTSLRGWYTTGHDIQREFHVFQLTKSYGQWNISNFRDPYNACLSITILPTIFVNLLHVRDPYIFKTFFQFIFASVPVLVFTFMRRYLSKAKAFLAAVYFISFPTYFTDMPFLNRQEIAFLFLALMLLVVLDARISLRKRQWLFIFFGLGMTLSHYSTTYSVLGILIFVGIVKPLFNFMATRFSKLKSLRYSSIDTLYGARKKAIPALTIPVIILVLYFCFMWDTVITNTSNNASGLVQQIVGGFTSGLNEDARSNDVSYSILGSGASSPSEELKSYTKNVVDKARASASPGTYYSSAVVSKFPLKVAPPDMLSLTALGRWLQRNGINVFSLNTILKQSWAKLLQLFVAIGLVYVLFKRKFNRTIDSELYVIAIGSCLFVVAQVVLPYISIAYGLLRAFQQSLMVLGLFLVVGTFAVSAKLRPKALCSFVPAGLAIFFFLASTSVISQILGGYAPQLHLNNNGQYYDIYYLHATEVAAINWLSTQEAVNSNSTDVQTEVQTDRYAFSKITSLTDIYPQDDITPGLIRVNSFVYLGYTDVVKKQATISYNGNLFTYSYPVQFLNQNKNLIYSNGGSDFYR